MKTKELKNVIKNFMKKHKKGICIFMGLAVLSTGIAIAKIKKNNDNSFDIIDDFERTVYIEKGDINKAINVKGTIQSAEVSIVSTSLVEKVKAVNVKVGDFVKKGDVICTLDDTEIKKEIQKKNEEINEERGNLQENYNKLMEQLNALKNSKSQIISAQDTIVANSKTVLEKAENDLNNYEKTYLNTQNTYNTMLGAISHKQNTYNEALNHKDSCYNNWIKSGGKVDSNEYKEYKKAEDNVNAKKSELESAKTLYNYDEITNNYNSVSALYAEKVSTRNSAKEQYDAAVVGRTTAVQAIDSEIQGLESNVKDAAKQLNDLNNNEEIKELEEKLSKTVLKAETDGKITELTVNVGSVPEGKIATIQSVDKLLISVNIPEYDIQNVNLGMEAIITTDSSDEKFSGKVTRISPTADSTESTGFSADISIENAKGMYIGTKAKAEIIISAKKDICIVPIDAVREFEGRSTIFIKNNDSFEEIDVIVGEKNDYYVEISGDKVEEGIEIRADITNEFISDDISTKEVIE